MYLFTNDAHEMWFNTAAMKADGIGAHTPDPDPGKQYLERDADGVPTGHAVEAAAFIPICLALRMFSLDSIRASQRLTLDRAPSWGMTPYMDAGLLIAGTTSISALTAMNNGSATAGSSALSFMSKKMSAQCRPSWATK